MKLSLFNGKLFSVLILLIFISNAVVFAQDSNKPFVLGRVEEIKSKELSETRTLNIYLPEGYNKDTAHYPVIYLLDGSANEDFIHIVGLVQFLTMIGAMPQSIVVGIANVDRRRDFTYPTTIDSDRVNYPTTGHSEKFISFLGKELQPYIQSHYRTNSSKTIIGQSLGGLVATEILFKDPALFSDYIIVSPSLWWDNESLLSGSQRLAKPLPGSVKQVYVSVGAEGKQMDDDAKTLVDMLHRHGSTALKIYFVSLPEEDHLTILHNSVYKAFELLNAKK